jgi:hypothetical protein
MSPLPDTALREEVAPEKQTALPVRTDRRTLAALLFRFLESVLSLARDGTDLRIAAAPERGQANLGYGTLVVSWHPGPAPQHSPFSRPEVGLLIARAGWERAGAEWIHTRSESVETCTVRLPLSSPFAAR